MACCEERTIDGLVDIEADNLFVANETELNNLVVDGTADFLGPVNIAGSPIDLANINCTTLTATGAISGASLAAPLINGTTIQASGALNGNSLAVTTGVSAATLTTTGTANINTLLLANPLAEAEGGTGSTSLATITVGTASNIQGGTTNQIPYQSAASTTTFTGPGTSGQVLTSNSPGAPTFQSIPATNLATGVTGTLGVGNGGTGQTSLSAVTVGNATAAVTSTNLAGGTTGQVAYQSGVGATGFTGPGTSGQVLTSNGASAPTYQAIPATNLATGVTGTLPVANGGTGQTSLASVSVGSATTATNVAGGAIGQVLYQTGSGATGFISPSTAGLVLKSNGASVAPSFQSVTATAPTYQIFTSGSGTYTPPAGVSYLIVEMVGGGGGGGRNSGANPAWGGNGGCYLKVRFSSGTYSYSVGSGGAGSSTAGVSGTAGGSSTFSTLSALFGDGGNWDPNGTNSIPSVPTTTGALQVFAAIPGGIGWSGGSAVGNLNSGAASFFAPQTPVVVQNSFATLKNAVGYGGGGGGTGSAVVAGNGSGGRIIVTEIY